MYKLTWVLVGFVFTSSSPPLGGQGARERCGSLADADVHLAEHAFLFTDDAGAPFRDRNGMAVVPVSEVRMMTDERVCGKIVPQVEADAQADYAPTSYAVYQFGDYYAMEVAPPPPRGMERLRSRGRLYVFDARGMKYLTLVVF